MKAGLLLLWFVPPVVFAADAVIAGRVLDAATGRVMPATVAIRASDGRVLTEHPSFRGGFRSNGAFEKALAPGRISVTVSRGFDYAPESRALDVRSGERRELEFRLRAGRRCAMPAGFAATITST